MADARQLTTDQDNFWRAIETMKLDLLRSGKEPTWLVAHPGLHTLPPGQALTWGQVDGRCLTDVRVCALQVVELDSCPPGAFYLAHRRPDGA